ncbi:Protein of unknown function [Pyronema omphalodes CBS 100304]|uniref:Uncharacterized protein n=1 Tax=Pyronema omphalodes (strain CBS 100304) TaxID=1076935 RepID=U4LDS7_PYROM|nr:Protein of unknown function [Pyronema omphalodes CBS 100304]
MAKCSPKPAIKKADTTKKYPRRSPALATSFSTTIQDAVMTPIIQEMQSNTYIQQTFKLLKQILDKLNIQLSGTSMNFSTILMMFIAIPIVYTVVMWILNLFAKTLLLIGFGLLAVGYHTAWKGMANKEGGGAGRGDSRVKGGDAAKVAGLAAAAAAADEVKKDLEESGLRKRVV